MTDHLETLAARRTKLIEARDEAIDALKEVDEQILAMVDPGETIEVDGAPAWVVNKPQRRWNAERAAALLPSSFIERITVTETKIDGARAKQMLSPTWYAMCCTETKPSISRARR